MSGKTTRWRVSRVRDDAVEQRGDLLAVEEPLELRIDGEPLTVTMRTPGDDIDLAAGFLYTEGLLGSLDQVREIRMCDENVAAVSPAAGAALAPSSRNFVTTSACGVCGKDSIEAIPVRRGRRSRAGVRRGAGLAAGPAAARPAGVRQHRRTARGRPVHRGR